MDSVTETELMDARTYVLFLALVRQVSGVRHETAWHKTHPRHMPHAAIDLLSAPVTAARTDGAPDCSRRSRIVAA